MIESTTKNLRQILRRETTALHSRLDEVMGTHPPFESLANYERYLSGMRSICEYSAASTDWVEKRLRPASRGSDLSHLLDEDLATLGVDRQYVQRLPSPTLTDGQHWGRAYVIEGSAMGAMFLLKQAEKDLPTQVGKSFLQQSAANAKSRWPVFAEALASTVVNASDAIAGANDVFDHAYQVFKSEAN